MVLSHISCGPCLVGLSFELRPEVSLEKKMPDWKSFREMFSLPVVLAILAVGFTIDFIGYEHGQFVWIGFYALMELSFLVLKRKYEAMWSLLFVAISALFLPLKNPGVHNLLAILSLVYWLGFSFIRIVRKEQAYRKRVGVQLSFPFEDK